MILDLGAGNGWLSYRLAQRHHTVATVDLLDDQLDGLAAHVHYDAGFTPIQAEFDRLPLAGQQADLVIFNASFHYSTDYVATLREALRVLRLDGATVIMDSPLYHDASSGARMVQEREARFQELYGFAGNALPGENYLTYARLDELATALGLRWRKVTPFYGWRWALRPWKARLLRRPRAGALPPAHRGKVPHMRRQWWRLWLRARFLLFQRHRFGRLVLEEVGGTPLLVLPEVFNPRLFRTGEALAQALNGQLIPPGSTVLDMGTGSGIGAIFAARWAQRVVAVDVNPEAVRCTRINTLLNRVERIVEVREGDLFGAVPGELFDVVLFNPPYYRGAPQSRLDHAFRSPDVIERFAAGLKHHLRSGGHALLVLSSDGDVHSFLRSAGRRRLADRNGMGEGLAERSAGDLSGSWLPRR